MKFILLFMLAACMLLLTNCQAQQPEGTKVHHDIEYVADGHERQKLDIYQPTADGDPDPLVVWVHGGAWRTGDKQGCPAKFLVSNGFAVASINYRLSQHAVFPAQVEDCKSAIRWLRDHADEYEIDADKIGVWGSSAGGHLVALLGTSADVEELGDKSELTSSRVQAVCDYFGPIDFSKMNEQAGAEGKIDHDATDSPESVLIGGAVQKNPDKVKLANPTTYIDKSDPPFLIVHGDADRLVPVEQSRDFYKALKAGNVEAELIVVPNAGHGQFREPKLPERVAGFFEKQLNGDQ